MDFNVFDKDLEEARRASELLENDIFFKAVEKVLTKYAQTEEMLVLEDNQKDFREQMRRVQHNAMMRRCLLDVVSEIEAIITKGEAIRSLED